MKKFLLLPTIVEIFQIPLKGVNNWIQLIESVMFQYVSNKLN